MIEGRIEDPALHAHLAFQCDEVFPDAIIDHNVALDLYVDGEARVFQKAIHLAQRWDANVLIAFHAVGKIQALEVLAGHVYHAAGTIGSAVHRFIMNHHELAIGAHVDIQFHAVRALLRCKFKRRDGVFRRIAARAPVRPNLCCHIATPFLSHIHFLDYTIFLMRKKQPCVNILLMLPQFAPASA